MAIASSTSSRRQCSSHGAGQTRPRTLGNGIVRLKMRVLSRQSASALALRKPGMSMWLGHLFWQGGRQYALWSLKISSRFVRRSRRSSSVWVWTFISGSHVARARDRRVLLALDLDDAHPAGAEARAAWARSTGSGSRSRCRGRPRGSSGPRSPRRRGRRPRSGCAATTAGAAAPACRAGARRAIVPRLDRGAAVGARDEVSHASPS